MNWITLRNGVVLPEIGLGTWQMVDREAVSRCLTAAYEAGYRLIDTAAAYSNEIAIAKAIASAGIPREELLLSDKVWNTNRGFTQVQEACKRSMKKLKTDYLDLYLIHWPASARLYPDWETINAETWAGMEALLEGGYVRAIGVCNFKTHHLQALRKTAKIMPFVNQVELHPGMAQDELREYCRETGIQLEASSPLGSGQVLNHPLLREIAAGHGKTAAQVCLRWGLDKGAILIPRSSNPERLRANLDVFDFTLTQQETEEIDRMPYCGGIGLDPDEVTEFG